MSRTPSPRDRSVAPPLVVVIGLSVMALFGTLPGTEGPGHGPGPAPGGPGQPGPAAHPTSRPGPPRAGKLPQLTGMPVPRTPEELVRQLHELDRAYAVDVAVHQREAKAGPPVLGEVDEAALHPSYAVTDELCEMADPYDADDDEIPRAARLRWVRSMEDMAPVEAALRLVPGASVEDMAAVWFGAGRGFEHVFCGELGGPPGDRHLGGYHWWDRHRRLAEAGKARYEGGELPPGEDRFVVGQFHVDFDGDGPQPGLRKGFKGGFSVGHSPAALAVLGYVGARLGWKSPVPGNLNGREVEWTLYRDRETDATIRTLWPRS